MGQSGEAVEGEEEDREAFAVHPSNADALRVFLGLANKWRPDSMNGRMLSPDYPDVDVVIDRLKIKDGDRAFEDFLVMENAALRALNDKQ